MYTPSLFYGGTSCTPHILHRLYRPENIDNVSLQTLQNEKNRSRNFEMDKTYFNQTQPLYRSKTKHRVGWSEIHPLKERNSKKVEF